MLTLAMTACASSERDASTADQPSMANTADVHGASEPGRIPAMTVDSSSPPATLPAPGSMAGMVVSDSGPAADGGASTPAVGGASGTAGAVAGSSAGAGGAVTAGASGAAAADSATFMLGADVTDQEPAPAATRAILLALLKAHGFNAIRLRTFVDPKARDGYDKADGYGDAAHTVAFGKQVKEAGLKLLVDVHYSDNWADPGKQCVPVSWQDRTTIEQLAGALHDYTEDLVTQLAAGGARPDMIQIGNEITPGMLIHRCDGNGQPTGENPINGSTSNWKNLGLLLQSGATAVRDVDPRIAISLHIDRGGDKPSDSPGTALQASTVWLTNATKYVQIDAFGLSCYQRYQGDPNDAAKTKAGWNATFAGLAAKFPNIRLFAAEYGPLQREVNDVVFGLAHEQGVGTFNWEPTTRGDWNTGHDLLRRSRDTYEPQSDLQLYDQMKLDYATRL
jgi:arabinogalactan endo-1,4-beta-galactosidase